MNSFRISLITLSLTLMFSIGSSATATQNYQHPSFSVTENQTLSLREEGTRIVIDTIKNALTVGGVELFGGGFQIDSSIGYNSGDYEGIKGDLDVVVPLLHIGRHVLFAQPGAVFWTGIEKEERIDGNFGLVYRNQLTRDLIGGVSFFYDQDFQIGHSRASAGIDLQSGSVLLGANYYHVLSEVEDGREGFIEEAVDGMDLRLAIEKEIVRAEASVGYWDYTGEETGGMADPQSGWQTSMGIDFGVRVIPGVFVEAGWEKHKDDLVLDERIFAGLAFRFSLPGFEGASYGDGSMAANLYKIVDREKRILYEERVANPTVSVALPDGVSANVEEGGMVNVEIQLSEALLENVTINLVGSGTAEYGSSNDYTVSIGGTPCDGVTEDNCQVTIAMGETSATVQVSVNEDGGGESPETIILSTAIALAGNTDLMPSGSLVLTIPADPPLPTVSLSANTTSITEGNTATITLTLSGELGSNATFNLISGGTEATYGTSNDWNLSVGGNDCPMATESNPCQVTISQGATTAEVIVEVNRDMTVESLEKFTVSITVDSGSTNFVMPGNSSSLEFTIESLPTVSLSTTVMGNRITEAGFGVFHITLSEALASDITINIVEDRTNSTASYGTGADWNIADSPLGRKDCASITGSSCQFVIRAGSTSVNALIEANIDTESEPDEIASFSIQVDTASNHLAEIGSSSNLMFTIADP